MVDNHRGGVGGGGVVGVANPDYGAARRAGKTIVRCNCLTNILISYLGIWDEKRISCI
jgi:hypothetical protein